MFTLVAVIIDVNARAQRLAEHPEVTTKSGSSNPLKTHTQNKLDITDRTIMKTKLKDGLIRHYIVLTACHVKL